MSQAAQPGGQAEKADAADDLDEISSVSPLEVKCPCECSSKHGALIEKAYKWVTTTSPEIRQVLRWIAFRDCDVDGVRFGLPGTSKTVCLTMHCVIHGISKSAACAERQAFIAGEIPVFDRTTSRGRPRGPGRRARRGRGIAKQ